VSHAGRRDILYFVKSSFVKNYIRLEQEITSCFSSAYFCCTDGIFMMTSHNSAGFLSGYLYKNVLNVIFCVVRVISNLCIARHAVNPRSVWGVTGSDHGLLDKTVLRDFLWEK
jgi:hypothetical protein